MLTNMSRIIHIYNISRIIKNEPVSLTSELKLPQCPSYHYINKIYD